jgi:hypothetical protein
MRDDGGPAFPRTGEGVGNPNYDEPGMTLRQWYAGLAMMGMAWFQMKTDSSEMVEPEKAAHCAFQMADAMIAEDREVRNECK